MKSKSTLLGIRLFTCVVSVALVPSIALAGDFTWDGGGPDGSWIIGSNWVGDPSSPPGMGIDSVQTFYATGTTNLATFLGGSRVMGTLNFNADADSDISVRFAELAVGGLTRSLTFDVTTGSAALNVDPDATGNFTLGVSDAPGNITLSDNLVITHNGTGNLTINRPIGLTTSGTLLSVTKAGTGTLILATPNTFDGGFILSAGTVNITDVNSVGKTGGALTIDGGAIDNTLSPTGALNLGARPLTINGDFTFKGTSGTLNLGTGATTLGTAAGTTRTITVSASTLTIAGIIADGTTATGITKEGAGVLTLNGKSTFTGPLQINSGSLTVGSAATFTSSGLTVGGPAATGTPLLSGQNTINVPTTFAAASGGVAGTEQPGGTSVGTHTFTSSVTYDSGATLAWQVNTTATTDPGANTDNYGTYDKVVANGTAGSVTGGAAVFKIAVISSTYSDAFWDTNKSWSNIYSGAGAPANLAAVFSSFSGPGVDANGFVTGQGQFTFAGSTLQWTAGAVPANYYDNWSTGLANPAFDFDSDNDGIENGLEWILGGNASQNDTPSVLPAVTGNATTGLTLTFTREEDSLTETTLTLEYATGLGGPWTSEIIDQDGGSLANGVVVTVNEAASPDSVIINIPASNAPNGRLFARLKAVRN